MAINLVTHRKGGKSADMVTAARQLKALMLKHGAEDLQLSAEIAGPAAGQFVLAIRFSNWESYGRAMAGSMSDPESQSALAQIEVAGELVSRRLVASIDL